MVAMAVSRCTIVGAIIGTAFELPMLECVPRVEFAILLLANGDYP
jgi:hypothetical protein